MDRLSIEKIREALVAGKTKFEFDVGYGFCGGSTPMPVYLDLGDAEMVEAMTDSDLECEVEDQLREAFMERASFFVVAVDERKGR